MTHDREVELGRGSSRSEGSVCPAILLFRIESSGHSGSMATKHPTTKKQTAGKKQTVSKKQTASKKRKPANTTSQHPDAIAVLKADHQRVTDLFDTFDGLGPRAHKTRESTVAKIIKELSVHAGIEETVFYPAVRERLASDDEPLVLEALEEHHLVKLTLNELESMASTSERFAAKVTVLREVVDHHVKEEETELFKQVRKAFSKAELVNLGEQLDAARSSAPTRPHPTAPDTPPGNLVADVLAAPLDAATQISSKAADVIRGAVS